MSDCRRTSERSWQARCRNFTRPPAEFALDLAGIHGVAEIMAGTIGDEADQPAARTRGGGRNFVEQFADLRSTTSRLLRSQRAPML